jgi:hypothetical protein
MVWWQVVLILLASAVMGILSGYMIYRLINYFGRKGRSFPKRRLFVNRRNKPRAEEVKLEATPGAEEHRQAIATVTQEPERKKEDKKALGMVPLFSGRAIMVLAIGLIVGIGLGLCYWAISPINANVRMGWPPIDVATIFEKQPDVYESKVKVSLIAPGASFQSLHNLQKQGEYYISRINNPHFWAFLSNEIAAQKAEYAHSATELEQMISARYDWNSGYPAFEIKVTSLDKDEAFFLVGFTTSTFQDYLITDERNIKLEEYQEAVEEMESVKAAVVEAENELAQLRLEATAYDINLDPSYIALKARVSALERALDALADEIALLYNTSATDEDDREPREEWEILAEMDDVSVALSEAKSELIVFEANETLNALEQSVVYSAAQSKVNKLRSQLNGLNQNVALLASSINSVAPEAAGFLKIEQPTQPTVVPQEKVRGRNAFMMGGIFGIGGAWLILNRKWLSKELLSLSKEKEEGES